MTTSSKRISYLTISDIHLYNDLNETSYITKSLEIYFDNYADTSRFAKLDIIFIAGDIFDYWKDTKHPDVVFPLIWMQRLMAFCKRNGIKLRILEGTPSHDYKQARTFQSLADSMGPQLDYRYFEVLSIEKMEDLGVSILYVPDEWAGSAAACQEQVQELLDRNGLEQVDIGCMHGMFDFQIPDLGEHPLKHDSQWYLKKIKGFCNIGHDHGFSTMDRLLVQGSFDRIAHGEEGKKGGIICTIDPINGNSFEFIENKNARIFKTINIKTKDLDKALEQVHTALAKVPDNAHIRISSAPDNQIFTVIDELKKSYSGMRFKKHIDKKQQEQSTGKLQETIDLHANYVSIAITKDTVVDLLFKELAGDMSPNEESLLLLELEAIL